MTGCTWEETPDGRPGWHEYFMRAGYDTYVSDAVERGRASWPAQELGGSGQAEHRTIEQAWEQFRIGEPGGGAYPGQQFPADCMPQLARQFVGRWVSNRERAIDAYEELLVRAGPGIVVAHSEGGRLAQSVLQRAPRHFKALVLIEPAGGIEADAAALARMAAVPVCVVWGDYFDSSPQWRRYRQLADAWLDGLERAGGSVTRLDLPAMGIAGNSHLPMMDRNNVRVAALVDAWIRGCAD
ncbi:esterase [Achromobacter denitrificans]|nr:esterase [Achromobacter denitrificans]